jgi:hypothetical protein
MSDSFAVTAKNTSLLENSYVVSEMRSDWADSRQEMFPVLYDNDIIGYYHDIEGGYHREDGYDVVNLVHQVQGTESPTMPPSNLGVAEAHLSSTFFNLEVESTWEMNDYPNENYVLSLKVTDYMMGEHSFSEALTADIDGRETRFQPNG